MTGLSEVQLRDFDTMGYVVLAGVVDALLAAEALAVADALLDALPLPERPGAHYAFPLLAAAPALEALVTETGLVGIVETLVGAGELEPPASVQLAATQPPFPRGVGRPHVDGSTGEPGGRPHTFSLLAGITLTDQRRPDQGGLWVWPGSHREHAAHYAGASFWAGDPGYPDVTRATPVQLLTAPGDLVLAHHLLGHCPGGVTAVGRRVSGYLRLSRRDHAAHWQQALTDPRRDFPGLSASGAAPSR